MLRAAATVLVLVLCGACSSKPSETYTVRAKVEQVQGSLWKLHHEAIPTFRNQDGKAVGMEAMTMNFAAPPEGEAKAGDLVEVSFEVRWGEKPPLRIRTVKTLPTTATLKL